MPAVSTSVESSWNGCGGSGVRAVFAQSQCILNILKYVAMNGFSPPRDDFRVRVLTGSMGDAYFPGWT